MSFLNIDMCINANLIILFIIMVLTGAFGGYVSYIYENSFLRVENLDSKKYNPKDYIILGIAASILVPLFLSLLSSDLFDKAKALSNDLFVYVGFCLLSSISASRFINGMSDTVLKNLENKDKELTYSIENQQKTIHHLKNQLDTVKFKLEFLNVILDYAETDPKKAYTHIQKWTKEHPEIPLLWATQAYVEKRLNKYSNALESITKAISLSSDFHGEWIYNKACYQCLCFEPVEEIIKTLRILENIDDPFIINLLKGLHKDKDFDEIRKQKQFTDFESQFTL